VRFSLFVCDRDSAAENIQPTIEPLRILNLTPNKAELFTAVKLRHDCVHRNGFDKDGNELTVFTKAFVSETADLVRDFVESIENAVRARPTS
jgi:hypothetical protein